MTVQCVSSGFLSFSQNVFNVTPDILFDGLRAFKQGSPNMNSLVGFGSAAAFAISSVSLLNPELEWNSTFFDEPVSDLPCTHVSSSC
jgi:cation transport ATPase